MRDGARTLCVPTQAGSRSYVPDCACVLAATGTMLEEALTLDMRAACDVAFPTDVYRRIYETSPRLAEIGQDPFRLRVVDELHAWWLGIPTIAQRFAADLDAAQAPSPIARTLLEAARLRDAHVPSMPAPPSPSGSFADELEALVVAAGGTPDRADIDAQSAALPAAMQAELLPLLPALAAALAAREDAVALFGTRDREGLWALGPGLFMGGTGTAPSPQAAWVQGALRGDVDVDGMTRAAIALAVAIEAIDAAALRGMAATLTVETPAGRIAIRGAGPDTYEGAPWAETLLVIDTGGDDVYRNAIGATASIDNGVSIALDLGGADTYGYVEMPVAADVGPAGHERLPSDGPGRVPAGASNGPFSLSDSPRQGAGRLGIGMLVDLGLENDQHRSLRMSQGFGALGVGVLYDEAGDDLYHGEAAVQGAASFGIGLLIDRAGTDRYVAYHAAQAFAYAEAIGILYDASGDDTYFAHPSDVLYWSPQDPGGSNSSFTQGAGFGRRADFGDQIFMSGGVAILRDQGGHDRYTCGIFGIATGYWFGAGFLLDAAGDDHYDGQWYVEAGNAHYAIAALIDDAGSDTFNETARRMNVAFGGGHDFSAAWFVDRAGNDVYRGPGLAFGVGHAGGFGAFVDVGGTDGYESFSDFTYGHASIETPGDALRRLTGSVGVFLERGGTDTYVRPMIGPVGNDLSWTQALHTGENEHGAGVDRETGTLGVPGLSE
jgi:hypothetical protein